MKLDLLAIAAHPDDAELTCGGTLALAASQGHKVGIVDLVAGEAGTRGSASRRADEAEHAVKTLGIHARANAGLKDAHLFNSDESRRRVISLIRRFRPRTVILPFPVGR